MSTETESNEPRAKSSRTEQDQQQQDDDGDIEDNPYAESSDLSDLVLLVENKHLHVNKSVLMIASPVFKAMFSHGFKESTLSVIELKDKKYKEMVLFLRCIYPDTVDPITCKL